MQTKTLPTPEALAAMVTNVTKTMFGITFALDTGTDTELPGQTWHAATLPIRGAHPLTVAIAADGEAARTLACAMFSCAPAGLDSTMIADALSEMVNIVAGQVKAALSLDQALGLPKVVSDAAPWSPPERWRSATLSRGETRTVVWVAITEDIV